nr:MAG TPA: hypothetical protein [Caudoviricetes sp.]
MKMPPEGSDGISLPIPDFQITPCTRRTNDIKFL